MKVLVRYMSIIAILIAADMIIAATDTPQRNWMRLNRSVTECCTINGEKCSIGNTKYVEDIEYSEVAACQQLNIPMPV